MNTKLIESLVQIIESLSLEEQVMLEEKLKGRKANNNSQEQNKKLVDLKKKILTRRQGEDFDPPLDQYIQDTRDERNAQQDKLINECFSQG